MKTQDQEILKLIKPLFDDFNYQIEPANAKQIRDFEKTALKKNVPPKAILEMIKFYNVTNGIPSLELDMHKCDDPIIYEFWTSKKQLWIGQIDMDMISWKGGFFHLGSAENLNYGKEYVFEKLLDLLKLGFNQWFQNRYEKIT